jgi:hypothetical protein
MKKKQKSSSSPQLPALDDSSLIKMDDLEVDKLDITTPCMNTPATMIPRSLATIIPGSPVQQTAAV